MLLDQNHGALGVGTMYMDCGKEFCELAKEEVSRLLPEGTEVDCVERLDTRSFSISAYFPERVTFERESRGFRTIPIPSRRRIVQIDRLEVEDKMVVIPRQPSLFEIIAAIDYGLSVTREEADESRLLKEEPVMLSEYGKKRLAYIAMQLEA